jgi:hypothetical protein
MFRSITNIVSFVGGVEQRMKPRPTFSVSVKLWLHSDMYEYLGCFFLDPEDIKNFSLGGHLELQQRKRAPLKWYQITGHRGTVFKA